MRVRPWDPATATDREIAAVVAGLNATLEVDLPDDPPWQVTRFREYLAVMMPGERRLCWLADIPGHDDPVGHANVLLLGDIGVLEVLVHPKVRQLGVGRALVKAAAERAAAEGLCSLGVEVVAGTSAVRFWENLGFRCAHVEQRSVLDLARVDWSEITRVSETAPPGYRIESYVGTLPAERLEAYAAAKATRRGVEAGDLGLHPSSYDAARLAASLDTLNRRGMRPYLVLAVKEHSGEVAALTEVVVPAQHPTRADQYDTIVVPDHRGLGLERVIKARMLRELRAAEPQLTQVQTWNAKENDPMARVNAELGYRPDVEWMEYEAEVAELVALLSR